MRICTREKRPAVKALLHEPSEDQLRVTPIRSGDSVIIKEMSCKTSSEDSCSRADVTAPKVTGADTKRSKAGGGGAKIT